MILPLGLLRNSSGYEYVSDYDFLILVRRLKELNCKDLWNALQKKLDDYPIKAKVNLLPYTLKFFNSELQRKQYFCCEIAREGIVLFKTRKAYLIHGDPLTEEESQKQKEEYFGQWYERAILFLKNYHFLLESGDYRTAAFSLHQVAESLLGALLLVFTGYKPRCHDLLVLEKRIDSAVERFSPIFPGVEQPEAHKRIEKFNTCYVDARYKRGFSTTREELEWFEGHVLRLKQTTCQLCAEEGIDTSLPISETSDKTTEEFITELENKWQNSDQKELALKTLHDYRDEVYRLGKKEGEEQGYQRGQDEGYQLGEESGVRKGIDQGKREMAKALKEKGVDPNIITEISGLTFQEIDEL